MSNGELMTLFLIGVAVVAGVSIAAYLVLH